MTMRWIASKLRGTPQDRIVWLKDNGEILYACTVYDNLKNLSVGWHRDHRRAYKFSRHIARKVARNYGGHVSKVAPERRHEQSCGQQYLGPGLW